MIDPLEQFDTGWFHEGRNARRLMVVDTIIVRTDGDAALRRHPRAGGRGGHHKVALECAVRETSV
jgi:hypothetical protein